MVEQIHGILVLIVDDMFRWLSIKDGVLVTAYVTGFAAWLGINMLGSVLPKRPPDMTVFVVLEWIQKNLLNSLDCSCYRRVNFPCLGGK